MNKTIQNTDRILLRVVTVVSALCAAAYHWWLAPLVLIAGEFGSRALLAYLDRPAASAEPKDRSVTASEQDGYALPNPAELANQSDYYTDPLYHRLPSNIWHNRLN